MVDTMNPNAESSAGLAGWKAKATDSLAAFSPGQRAMMGAAAALVVIGVLAMSVFGNKTELAPLMTNLVAEDAQAITAQLDSLGVPYELAGGGSTIMVPKDRVYQTRIDVASVDLPGSGKVGYGILDNTDLTSSEFSQHVNYQRAMEGELATTIESIDGVVAATVHLALPKNSTFALDHQAATGSVMVKTEGNSSLSGSQVQAVVNLVSGAIENLDPSDVTVTDAEGRVLASPNGPVGTGGGGVDNQETTAAYETSLAGSIESMLAKIVGEGHASVTVAADLDFDSSKSVSESYAPPSTIVPGQALAINESTRSENYSGSGAGDNAAGVLGTEGSAEGTNSPTDGSGGYQLDERQVNNAVDKVVEETSKAPGAINRLSVAVVLDEDAIGPDQITEVQTLVSAAAGLDPDRGDTVAISRLKLDQTATESMREELAFRENGDEPTATPIWMYAVAGVAAVAVIGFVLRRRKRKNLTLEPIEMMTRELPTSERDLVEGYGGSDREDGPGELVAVNAALDAASSEATSQSIDPTGRREALGDLIDNQPDEVADLLRSWLGDRRETPR